jgi:hypothetical protein
MAQRDKTEAQAIVDELTGLRPPHVAEPFVPSVSRRQVVIGVASEAAAPVADVDPSDLPKKLSDLTASVVRTYDLSVTGAGELSIPVVGSIGGGYNRRVVVLERAAYKVVMGHSGAEYHYGYAIRLCLTINKWDANLKVSLPFLAASAQMGQVEAAWMMQILGLAGVKIDEGIAPPNELSVETFVIAKQSLQALIEAVNDPTTVFAAHQIAKLESATIRDEAFRRGVVKAYALSRVARRASLQETLNRLQTGDPVANDSIRDTYDAIAPGGPGDRPSEEAARKARDLLGRIEADV